MLLLQPDQWPVGRPISLLSGNRMAGALHMASALAYQRAGVPLATVPVVDYLRLLRRFCGPDGQPTHTIPAQYAEIGL